MKTTSSTILFISCGLLAISAPAPAADDTSRLMSRATESVNIQEGNVNMGHATLIRSRQGARFRVSTTNLEPDSAYTIWVAVFNDPSQCIDGCNPPDVPAADASVFLGAAFVTDSSGTVNTEFAVQAGSLPQNLFVFDGHDIGLRRGNGFDAEMHLVFSYHGPSNLIEDWATKLLVPGELPGEQVALFIP